MPVKPRSPNATDIRDMAPGDKGAYAELIVAACLMEKGFEVFRALSPTATCDLIAMRSGKIVRIEVRTLYVSKKKGLTQRIRPGYNDWVALISPEKSQLRFFESTGAEIFL